MAVAATTVTVSLGSVGIFEHAECVVRSPVINQAMMSIAKASQ